MEGGIRLILKFWNGRVRILRANSLRPTTSMHILHTVHNSFLKVLNLFNNQDLLSLAIISFIPVNNQDIIRGDIATRN